MLQKHTVFSTDRTIGKEEKEHEKNGRGKSDRGF